MAKPQNGGGFVYYAHLLQKSPQNFLALLDRNLIDGGADGEAARMQLDVIAQEDAAAELMCAHRNEDGDTLAHTTATFHRKPELLAKLFDLSPGLLTETRQDDFAGQTPLHIVISKGNRKMARAILEHPQCEENRGAVLGAQAVGSKFRYTVMMGQLPLSVAALTFDKKMVALLLKHGAEIGGKNRDKDTVLHSLIRFAGVHSDKIHQALEMMMFINEQLPPHSRDIWHWAKNKEKLTPLKLAASLGLAEIFTAILNLDGVYRSLNAHDGLFDIHLYDITEIDTVTQAEWERYKGSLKTARVNREQNSSKSCSCIRCFTNYEKKRSWRDAEHRPALRHKSPAVLDIICRLPVKQAFDFIYVDAVKELIKRKWEHYKWFFAIWAVYHLLIMIHITTFAIYKTKIINTRLYTQYSASNTERAFVKVTAGLLIVYAIFYLAQELVRSLYFKQGWHMRLIQHNGLYRLMMVVFSLALVVDAIWFYIRPHNNYFLIVALIIGWTFMAFFLRTWKRFSFYTVMFQKVLLGDMTRLSVIILFQLVAFSIAIYTTFLNTKPVPSGFHNAGMAIMTMFKLMLGLTDIEVLQDAREPWLAILLYVLFVLVTYVLLINSLIAMMSRTCDLMSQDRNRQWEFQRLSVLLLLETMLLPPWRFLHKAGIKAIRRYGLRSHEFRCYVEITSIQTTYREGRSVLQRKSMIDTIGFGHDRGTSIWTPFFRKPDGNTGWHYQDPFSTVFQGASLHPVIPDESTDGEEDDAEGAGALGYEGLFEGDSEIDEFTEDKKFKETDDRLQSEAFSGEGNSNSLSHDHLQSSGKCALQRTVSRDHQKRQQMAMTAGHLESGRSPFLAAERKRYQKVLLANALLRQRLHVLMTGKKESLSKQIHGQEQPVKKRLEGSNEFDRSALSLRPHLKHTTTATGANWKEDAAENATFNDPTPTGVENQLSSEQNLHQSNQKRKEHRTQQQGQNYDSATEIAIPALDTFKQHIHNGQVDDNSTGHQMPNDLFPVDQIRPKEAHTNTISPPPVKIDEPILDSSGRANHQIMHQDPEQRDTTKSKTTKAPMTEQTVNRVMVAPSSERHGIELDQLGKGQLRSENRHAKQESTQTPSDKLLPRIQDIDISILDSFA